MRVMTVALPWLSCMPHGQITNCLYFSLQILEAQCVLPCNGMRVVSSYDSMCSSHCGNLEIVFCPKTRAPTKGSLRYSSHHQSHNFHTTCHEPRLSSPVHSTFQCLSQKATLTDKKVSSIKQASILLNSGPQSSNQRFFAYKNVTEMSILLQLQTDHSYPYILTSGICVFL